MPTEDGPSADDDAVEVEIEGIGTLETDVIQGAFDGEIGHDFMPDL